MCVNGILVAGSKDHGKKKVAMHDALLIGTLGEFAEDSGYADFSGAIGEICIYDRSLRQEEIQKLYETAIKSRR